jgi:hypothetical protein
MHAALRDLRKLVLAIPLPWQVACRAVLRARQPLDVVRVTAVLWLGLVLWLTWVGVHGMGEWFAQLL